MRVITLIALLISGIEINGVARMSSAKVEKISTFANETSKTSRICNCLEYAREDANYVYYRGVAYGRVSFNYSKNGIITLRSFATIKKGNNYNMRKKPGHTLGVSCR